MKNDYFQDPYVQTMISNMPEKTGKTLEEWFTLLKSNKFEQHSEIMNLLKKESGFNPWLCQYHLLAVSTKAGRRCPIR